MGLFGFLKGKSKAGQRRTVLDIDDGSFKLQVLQRSHKVPVMVDFWAEWCGPCRQLGPRLEALASEQDSPFFLAKLNTEDNPRISAQFRIQSIPAVKMFRNGHMVGEFTGALPTPVLRRFVAEMTGGQPPAPRIARPDDPAQRLQQAVQHLRKGRGFEATMLLQGMPPGPQAEQAEKLRPLARFLWDMDDGDGVTGHDQLDLLHDDAAHALQQRQTAQALQKLFAALEVGDSGERARTSAVIASLFALLGEQHKLTRQYAPQLAELA